MAKLRTLKNNFAGGIVTESLGGRGDLPKYASSVRDCKNFIVAPHGPARFRPGTTLCGIEPGPVRLTSFEFSTDQTLALAWGDYRLSFYRDGCAVLENYRTIGTATDGNPVTFTLTSPFHPYQTGDEVYIEEATSIETGFYRVVRISASTFSLEFYDGTPLSGSGLVADGRAYQKYVIATPYSYEQVLELNHTQSNDVVTLTHPDMPVRELRRYGYTNWTIDQVDFGPGIEPPDNPFVRTKRTDADPQSYTKAETLQRYRITSVSRGGIEESFESGPVLGPGNDITAMSNADPMVLTLATDRIPPIETTVVVLNSGISQLNNKVFIVSPLSGTNTAILLDPDTLDAIDSTFFGSYGGGGSLVQDGVVTDLGVADAYNTVTWDVNPDALRYNVYKESTGGGVFGFIGSAERPFFLDRNIEPDTENGPPQPNSFFNSDNEYPGAVSYIDQRRVFAASNDEPQKFWMSRPGAGANFSMSFPQVQSDAIEAQLSSRTRNRILHIVPLNDLILFTTGSEWRVFATEGNSIGPDTTSARPQSYVGSSQRPRPVTTRSAVLYTMRSSAHVMEMTYNGQSRTYQSVDVTVLIPDLVNDRRAVDASFSQLPVPVYWAVMDDGDLLAMTYFPEGEVRGWHRHETQGNFLSVTCTIEGPEDATYLCAERELAGGTAYTVERMASMFDKPRAESIHLDCSPQPYRVVEGLDGGGLTAAAFPSLRVFEGLGEIGCVADGAVIEGAEVVDGAVPAAGQPDNLIVGLPYSGLIEKLPLVADNLPGWGAGVQMNVSRVQLRVRHTGAVQVGVERGAAYEAVKPGYAPPSLVDDVLEIQQPGRWNQDAVVRVEQNLPLPVEVLQMIVTVEVGG